MKRRGAALALLALCACNPSVQNGGARPSPSASVNPVPSGLSLKITGKGTAQNPVRFVGQDKSNRRQYDLLASSFVSNGPQGQAVITFAGARITFHGTGGSQLEAKAPTAVLDQRADTITLEGGVHASNDSGMTLQCDDLVYDHKTQMLHGKGHVVITNRTGFRATGNRFDSDISLTHTKMQ